MDEKDKLIYERGIWYRLEHRKIVSKIWRRVGTLAALYVIFYGVGMLIIMYILVKH